MSDYKGLLSNKQFSKTCKNLQVLENSKNRPNFLISQGWV